MSSSVITRIKLPAEVHRQVKAQAVYHDITLAEALGMCVAFVCDITTPLLWRTEIGTVVVNLYHWADDNLPEG